MLCDTRFYLEAIVQLNESVEQTIYSPNIILGTGKCRIQGCDRVMLVVTERSAQFRRGRGALAREEVEQGEEQSTAQHGRKFWPKIRDLFQ